ncbi:MAG: GGDEF domain-containing response regulator [Actinomycetota bacterium]
MTNTFVLVVEEDEEQCARLRRQLSRQPSWTGELATASTLAEAEKVLRARRVDCVLVDLNLPDASGTEVVSRVRAIATDSPIVVLSNHDELETAREAVRSGAQDYLLAERLDGILLLQALTLAAERKRVEVDLARLAYHDELTGLPNHAFLTEEVDRSLRRRRTDLVGVIVLDVDGFSAINADLGHRAGDLVLVETAQRLAEATRDADLVARIGADQFAVVCEQVDSIDELESVVARLVDAVDRPIVLPGSAIRISATAGVALHPDHATPQALLAAARRGIDDARAAGRSWSRDGARPSSPNGAAEQGLFEALAHDQLVLHYQPIIDLRDRSTIGVEALVRWDHPDRGLLGPNAFLPHVQRQDALAELDAWVLQRACSDVAAFDDELGLHVNASLGRDGSSHLLGAVHSALATSGLAPSRLSIEVVERSTGLQLTRSAPMLGALAELGVSVALDDFGVGYSTLDVMLRVAVDVIKVDPSFIADAGTSARARQLLGSVRAMAEHLDLGLVIEGIESEEQHDIARRAGFTTGQGYLYGRPAPLSALR